MPLPTAPAKLGNLLPSEEYKAKARPAKQSKKQAEGDEPEAADYTAANAVGSARPKPFASRIR